MLETKQVLAFLPLGNDTINDKVNYCLDHLRTHIIHLLNEKIESGLQNYSLFYERIGRKITYNTKNIVFETQSKGLIALDDEHTQQNPSLPAVTGKQINEFFGRGEFPVVEIIFLRIGNQDYSFYTISR